KEIYPYVTEGIGEDFLPDNVNFDTIDHFEQVTDKDAAIYTRRIAREEGIFAGNSAGSAMAGLEQMKHLFKEGDVVVVIFHDHGTRYLAKMFNDDWMRYVGSMLYRKPMEVQPGVWSAIGATAPPTYENSGHNNNVSFVIGTDAVLVVNASDNYLLAESLHQEINAITNLPVKYVVLENGQGHAMLGMNYWQQEGAQVIAHIDTADVIEAHGQQILERMQFRNRDKAMGTQLSTADITFDTVHEIDLGNMKVQIQYLGPSHSPGDTQVWLPDRKLMIAGDLAFHERLLPVFDDSDTAGWIDTWESFEALQPEVVIPGHGHPTTIDVVRQWTIGYLQYMRSQVAQILDNGGSLIDAYNIDQSAFSHLDTFDELAGLNADRIYRAMEFE
ncbi:MAG: pyridoxal-phosphate dependent enzyme, partial [Pseudomonadota bacterium]